MTGRSPSYRSESEWLPPVATIQRWVALERQAPTPGAHRLARPSGIVVLRCLFSLPGGVWVFATGGSHSLSDL